MEWKTIADLPVFVEDDSPVAADSPASSKRSLTYEDFRMDTSKASSSGKSVEEEFTDDFERLYMQAP